MSKIINKGLEILNQYRGWKTNEKIVVFESDDWGAIRTTSNQALEELRKIEVDVDKCHYMLNDSIESKDDLEQLFSVLKKYRGKDGNHPVITFNTLVANPNFNEIRKDNFFKYHYNPFFECYEKDDAKEIMETWQYGIKEGIIYPQFHGREHVNIGRWLTDLQNGRKDTLVAFNYGMFGISGHILKEKRGSYLAVFDEVASDMEFIDKYLQEGLKIFRTTFGFSPKTFIAPNYVWGKYIEQQSFKSGIISMQGSSTQILPTNKGLKQGVVKNYIGKTSECGIGYLIRNVVFEPASDLNKDWVKSSLKQMELAFNQKRPVIIDTHRVNFMGTLNPNNRAFNLNLLDSLIREMLKKWPEIKFMHSEKLAELIYEN